jgi:hypothetical protein
MPLSFKRNLIFFLFLSGIIFPSTGVFASTACVCTTSDKDCREVTLSSAELLKLGCTIDCKKNLCETACKKELGTKYGSFDFGQDIEGDMKRDACKKTNQTFLATAAAASTTKPAEETIVPKGTITPTLNIDIPGLSFTSAVSGACKNSTGSTCIRSNFLADYLTGIYQFLIAASISIAIIMVMIGGLQYTLGAASPGMVSKGKTRIHNAVIGLVLLLGVYLVLYTANPQLTILKTVELQNVEEVIFDFSPETLTPDQYDAGPFNYKYFKDGKCPVQLTNDNEYDNPPKNTKPIKFVAHNLPRRLEFHEKIRGLLTGSTRLERVLQAVEAASLCKIQYANCGAATHAMYALASKPGSNAEAERCLINKNVKKECNSLGYGNGRKMIHNALATKIGGGLTIMDVTQGIFCPAVPFGNGKWKEPCSKTKQEAAQRLTQILLSASGRDKWSPNWVDELQPGDYYVIVNWNPSVGAAHSAMFLGWQDKANRIANIESADGRHFVHMSTKKFDAVDIVVQISRPVGN